MADNALVEGIKLIGGLAGLISAGFLVWDRAIRGRPVVNLMAPMPAGMSVPTKTLIVIHNPGSVDVAIREIETSDEKVRVSSDDTTMSLIETFSGMKRRIAAIPAGKERSFMVVDLRDDDHHGGDVKLTIRWRPVTARFPRRPVKVSLKAGILQELEEDARQRFRVAYEEGR